MELHSATRLTQGVPWLCGPASRRVCPFVVLLAALPPWGCSQAVDRSRNCVKSRSRWRVQATNHWYFGRTPHGWAIRAHGQVWNVTCPGPNPSQRRARPTRSGRAAIAAPDVVSAICEAASGRDCSARVKAAVHSSGGTAWRTARRRRSQAGSRSRPRASSKCRSAGHRSRVGTAGRGPSALIRHAVDGSPEWFASGSRGCDAGFSCCCAASLASVPAPPRSVDGITPGSSSCATGSAGFRLAGVFPAVRPVDRFFAVTPVAYPCAIRSGLAVRRTVRQRRSRIRV